ncbi:amidohydrolase [Mycolicibacterium parafortuitum]|uniref:Metal-dependent amidase / aminoacylase / carboxypeptidase [Gordonia sp. KTR9] n=1 Tax=Mycolicibacterium parafortuitum TaxID=39692 RepID=A0A375YIE2_MYCPF|nr:amidohydrolase [Mycolicibacterium parafortuitum]ORB32223.1 amidohydrolase [Mycolicibacterium parafortuitum]SRX80902.1 Metal-dependent amidase / aminoacylase / carboxypeptidase [Gordonia sp. KTR9] [Mycolicibacterium parafortuitum]
MAGPGELAIDPALTDLYKDLHRHPELGFQEHRTASIVADRLRAAGAEVTTGVGGTGVVGVLKNGDGPTALLRADMDALPLREQTGLDYASTATATTADGATVPVAHACGHDMHTVCLLGAATALAADRSRWSGTAVLVFQPAEELGAGAQAMVDDGLFDRFGRPDVILGQHVAPLPAGKIAGHPGPAYAASDSLRVRFIGRGAHGSMPEASVDPVVMASAAVMRLQTVISREVPSTAVAVLTVGSIHAGDAANVIPGHAEIQLNIRSYDAAVRQRILDAVHRIVRAEAAAAGAPEDPEITPTERFPVVTNSPEALRRTLDAFALWLGRDNIMDPGAGAGSEDVGILATSSGAPLSFWLLGGADPALFTTGDLSDPALLSVPSNHSPKYAPDLPKTLPVGVGALVTAARTWLPAAG